PASRPREEAPPPTARVALTPRPRRRQEAPTSLHDPVHGLPPRSLVERPRPIPRSRDLDGTPTVFDARAPEPLGKPPERLRLLGDFFHVLRLGTALPGVALVPLRDTTGVHLHALRARLVGDAAAIFPLRPVRKREEARNDHGPSDAPGLLDFLFVGRHT